MKFQTVSLRTQGRIVRNEKPEIVAVAFIPKTFGESVRIFRRNWLFLKILK